MRFATANNRDLKIVRHPHMSTTVNALREKLGSFENILIFWDGKSSGTRVFIDMVEKAGKNFRLVMI